MKLTPEVYSNETEFKGEPNFFGETKCFRFRADADADADADVDADADADVDSDPKQFYD